MLSVKCRCGVRSFPIDTATPQENQRLETRRGYKKTSIWCKTSSNFDILHMLSNRLECHKGSRLPRKTTCQPPWKASKRRDFATSPIDTQENKRLETRHVDAEKRAFRARLPPILIFYTCYQTGWNVTKCHACHAERH